MAISDHIFMEANCGEQIEDFAQRMVEAFSNHGRPVTGTHNGVAFTCDSSEQTAATLEDLWDRGREKRDEEYKNSPAYAANQAAHKARIETLQAKHDQLVADLPVKVNVFGATGDRENGFKLTTDLHGLFQAGMIVMNKRGTVMLSAKGDSASKDLPADSPIYNIDGG